MNWKKGDVGKRKVQATFWGDSLVPSTSSKSDSVWLLKFFKPLPNHHLMANRWGDNGNSDRLFFHVPGTIFLTAFGRNEPPFFSGSQGELMSLLCDFFIVNKALVSHLCGRGRLKTRFYLLQMATGK